MTDILNDKALDAAEAAFPLMGIKVVENLRERVAVCVKAYLAAVPKPEISGSRIDETAYKFAQGGTHWRERHDYDDLREFLQNYLEAAEMASDVVAYDEAKRQLASGEDKIAGPLQVHYPSDTLNLKPTIDNPCGHDLRMYDVCPRCGTPGFLVHLKKLSASDIPVVSEDLIRDVLRVSLSDL